MAIIKNQPAKKSAETSSAKDIEESAIKDLSTLFRHELKGVNIERHRAVLAMLKLFQRQSQGEKGSDMSLMVARVYGGGKYLAYQLERWGKAWTAERSNCQSERGKHAKTRTWFTDDSVQLGIRQHLSHVKGRKSIHISKAGCNSVLTFRYN